MRGKDPETPPLPTAALLCEVSDVQGTLVTRWRHDNETYTLSSGGRIQVSVSHDQQGNNITQLVINDLVYTDTGSYICEAMDDDMTNYTSATTNLTLLSE